jgi:hypothetical protein
VQLEAWAAKVTPKLERRKRALSIVLRFKADAQARKEAEVEAVMRRLADPAFPLELRLIVIEATIAPQFLHWKPPDDGTLDTIADPFFRWPRDVEIEARMLLRQTLVDVLLKAFLITLSFNSMSPVSFTIPQALEENATHIRRLVVKPPHLSSRTTGNITKLMATIESVACLRMIFPRLEVCIYLLSIETYWVRLRYIKQVERDTIKEEITQFVAAFLQNVPGKRKLVRLRICKNDSPLVELEPRETPGDANSELHSEDVGPGRQMFVLSAAPIVENMYNVLEGRLPW